MTSHETTELRALVRDDKVRWLTHRQDCSRCKPGKPDCHEGRMIFQDLVNSRSGLRASIELDKMPLPDQLPLFP